MARGSGTIILPNGPEITTCYMAVRSMHQAILVRAPENKEILERISLRYV